MADARLLEREVRRALGRAGGARVVLAVSGGRDSMALLHAAARMARRRIVAVATFDHGTGAAATRAAGLVADEAGALGLPVVVGRAARVGRTEAEWRDARRDFLADVAARSNAMIATAHTRDDHIETVMMRVLRDAGARGLAALFAPSDVFLRPLLGVSRAAVADYAAFVGARWMDDPMNASTRFLRNRVRRDLLPALTRTAPRLGDDLLAVAEGAARWRAQIDALAAAISVVDMQGGVRVPADELTAFDDGAARILWPAIAARVGVVMDWRGTERAAAFTKSAVSGRRIQLAGGWEILRGRDSFELVKSDREAFGGHRLESGVQVAEWRFVATRAVDRVSDQWVAQLPSGVPLTVRAWQAGDRMRLAWEGRDAGRRVKRFLNDARISGTRRERWPVVLAGDEIVWIPGVRRSDAAAVRPGRPGVLYRCELDVR